LYFRLDRAEQEKARVEELLARAKKETRPARNKVKKASDMLEDVLRQIGQHQRFVLTSHARPTAMPSARRWRAARSSAPWASMPTSCYTTAFPHLPFASVRRSGGAVKPRSRQLRGGDHSGMRQHSPHAPRGLEDRFLISIDHHVSGRPFAHVNWIDPHAVATAEMVFVSRAKPA